MATGSPAFSNANRVSQSMDSGLPPPPPPKPGNQEINRRSTPAGQPRPPPTPAHPDDVSTSYSQSQQQQDAQQNVLHAQRIQDPGDQWLPKILEDKSKQVVADMLANPNLVAALIHAPSTAHPSTTTSREPLDAALSENISLASHLNELEARIAHLRTSTQAQLLSTHALERQWRQKQADMDRALSPFSPSSLYQRLNQGVQEQELTCRAMEDSFLEGDGGVATEKEVTDWVKGYRQSKKLYYSRRERKDRWDEGRVGGWR